LNRYFCEPAYEKFRGTSEGALNSRLYNEKAYVLSRGFILRALERPPGSLESEVRGFYLSPGGQRRLEKVLKGAEDLISLSQALEGRSQTRSPSPNKGQPLEDLTKPPPVLDEDAAVPSLTAGGILTLKRVLSKLFNIQPNHSQLYSGITSSSS
jgi:ubiquitin-conjugating enzyme E2 O